MVAVVSCWPTAAQAVCSAVIKIKELELNQIFIKQFYNNTADVIITFLYLHFDA